MTRYAILFATLLGLAACETVGGMGRDLENAGDTLTDTADDVQDDFEDGM